jgi:Arc/MetJ-type ribon-helix-helix transcriptional regulator
MATDSSETVTEPGRSQPQPHWTPEIAKFIATEIGHGEYQSEAELVLEAGRQLREQELQFLRREIQIGIDDIEQNRVTHIVDDAAATLHMQEIWQCVLDRASQAIV